MDTIEKNLNMALLADKVELLKTIAKDYGLEADELIDKYINNASAANIKKACQKKKRNDYVETEEYTYQDVTYLVDQKNQVYTYNLEKPMLIGERLIDGTIKFFDAYFTVKQRSQPQAHEACEIH